jgi:hypothetical protein
MSGVVPAFGEVSSRKVAFRTGYMDPASHSSSFYFRAGALAMGRR